MGGHHRTPGHQAGRPENYKRDWWVGWEDVGRWGHCSASRLTDAVSGEALEA